MLSPSPPNSVRLFCAAGIEVYLHWSWALVAIYQVVERADRYSIIEWSVAEYLALFLIVLLHSFGHALACRRVGGRTDKIVLWPIGSVTYATPPQRPGAILWILLAGPLVNVVLAIPLGIMVFLEKTAALGTISRDYDRFITAVLTLDLFLLCLELLPIYPLDGGQILHALLWRPLGRARSLFVSTIVGFVGVAALAAFAIYQQSILFGILAYYARADA